MRGVPSDDPLVRKILVLDFVDVFPGVLREGNVGSRLCRVEPWYPRGDAQSVSKLFANQHSADFGFAVGACVLPDLAQYFALDRYSRLPLIWFPFTHFLNLKRCIRTQKFSSVIPSEARNLSETA